MSLANSHAVNPHLPFRLILDTPVTRGLFLSHFFATATLLAPDYAPRLAHRKPAIACIGQRQLEIQYVVNQQIVKRSIGYSEIALSH